MPTLFQFPIPELLPQAILPMALVALAGIAALILEMLFPKRNNNLIVIGSLIGLVLAAAALVPQLGREPIETAASMLYIDGLGVSMQLLIVVCTALAILFSEPYLRERKIPYGEFYPLVLWSAFGAMMLTITTNLLMVFLGVEILSIALYVLAGMGRTDERSSESALKYFLLGAFASGFLLYGMAFLYGSTGSLDLNALGLAWVQNQAWSQPLIVFGFALMMIGLSFKASFVPFHQWTPDVYQGAPTNVTAFMASVSKIGAFVAIYRLLEATTPMSAVWVTPLSVVAMLTMLGGNLAALVQTDLKRIMGYSSIGHAGYILVALIAHGKNPDQVGPQTLAYYMVGYAITTIGTFAVISMTARDGSDATRFESIRGLWQRSPLAAATLVLGAASLMGLPPTAGFFGKVLVFWDAQRADLLPLAIVLAISSLISAAYYLGLVRAVFTSEESEETSVAPLQPVTALTCAVCAVAIVLMGALSGPLTERLGLKVAPPSVARLEAAP